MALPMKPLPERPELKRALADEKKRWDGLTREQQEAELRQQRESWARQDMD